jgi:hypothetical protein
MKNINICPVLIAIKDKFSIGKGFNNLFLQAISFKKVL